MNSYSYLAATGIAVVIIGMGGPQTADAQQAKTRVVIEDGMFVQSDADLRKAVDEIVFVRGVVQYNPKLKNPMSVLKTSFGETYRCMGIEKYAGREVVLAAVPYVVQTVLPSREVPSGVVVMQEGEPKPIGLKRSRIVHVGEEVSSGEKID